ncbi:DoxX family protein [Actinopolymorpha singaporensis]|uniref:Uncharacterized membrane protein YphA, DoxX/SURF4 family n=1 Tax=Actinopolymorpha singaporensis TaxID=117157 RepID=A0A1H1YNE3_9ACTN|nr:DoxX family protein [Actinopolymorpha singaporensis]SDT22953.1 Uncharacterized membrane protein YphA, DoxX/SURF4 family [Actinopolymorpha singaporensis]
MTLVRMIARPMLASTFVVHGVRAIRNPDPLVPSAKSVTDQLVPTAKRMAPPAIADRIPEDPRTLVRINGAVQVVGGIALATGVGRRWGALALAASVLPTTYAGHAFWEEKDAESRGQQQVHFLKNVSIFGGLLLAAVDTEGKPGLAWRASHSAEHTRAATRRMTRSARREAKLAARTARQEAKLAKLFARQEARLAAKASKPARLTRSTKRDAKRAGKAAKALTSSATHAAKPVLAKAGIGS